MMEERERATFRAAKGGIRDSHFSGMSCFGRGLFQAWIVSGMAWPDWATQNPPHSGMRVFH
jgi:hypothetical protein